MSAQTCLTNRCQGTHILDMDMRPAFPGRDEGSKPMVMGLYGIPGCGKSFVLSYLKQELDGEDFEFFEGAEKIATLVPGGLDAFHNLDEGEKTHWRSRAIREIGTESKESGRSAIVTGHYMFWSESDDVRHLVYTDNDLTTFTHILYLADDTECIARRRSEDSLRKRPQDTAGHLRKWQEAEIEGLRSLCHKHGIIFTILQMQPAFQHRVSSLVRLFRQDLLGDSSSLALQRLDHVLPDRQRLQTLLVLDADKTLAPADAGALFWEARGELQPSSAVANPLKELFGGPLGYTDAAFRQATLLYEEATTNDEYEALCESVATRIGMYDEIRNLLRVATEPEHIGVVVVTCGLRRVWERVLAREGLFPTVKVIGGGRTSDGFVMTAEAKAAIVSQLRTEGLRVIAFGDSPLDLPMLKAADEAIIVVGEEGARSQSMDSALEEAINKDGLRARQTLLPDHVSARLDGGKLPQVRLHDEDFVKSIVGDDVGDDSIALDHWILHATNKEATKLLMTPTRDASVAGPALRAAHQTLGRYLGLEYLPTILGLEEYPIQHVQGHHTNGHRLQNERQTTIVALMRGGEPMALGLNEVFPQAAFLHATCPEDIKQEHLQNQCALVLVDSVINTGKTLAHFIERTRRLQSSIRILVVAGVVQDEVVSRRHHLARLMVRCNVSLIALRISGNKFTGKGATDTGNRLFQWYG